MSACHRGRVEAAKALLRSGADPNYENDAGDLTLFWGIDGGIELIKVLLQYGADIDATSSKKDWTPLSYAKAMGKYGLTSKRASTPRTSSSTTAQPSTARVRIASALGLRGRASTRARRPSAAIAVPTRRSPSTRKRKREKGEFILVFCSPTFARYDSFTSRADRLAARKPHPVRREHARQFRVPRRDRLELADDDSRPLS